MLVQFKEKTYEKFVCAELARSTKQFFSPDPFDEAFLGFDDAFALPEPILRAIDPYLRRGFRQSRRYGIRLSDLDFLPDRLSDQLPPFRLNLFLQYKRPDYLRRATAKEWPQWGGAYYRYMTTPHQQAILEQIEIQAAGRAATLYASPAFWRSAELFSHAENETVLVNSNLANVLRLAGHRRLTYDSCGTFGIACSEPTPIESDSLQAIMDRAAELEPLPLNQHIRRMAKTIETVVRQSRYERELFARARRISEIGTLRGPQVMQDLASIVAFSDAFDVTYYALG